MKRPGEAAVAAIIVVLALLAGSCSLPKIMILHDPLAPEEHDRLGSIYESQGKFELAAAQYREALNRDKKHLPSLLLLGDVSYRMKNYAEAEATYLKALKLDSKNSEVRNNLAWVYIATGKKLDTAKGLISEALAQAPALRPYFLDTLGVILVKLGHPDEAIRVLKESVETIPKERRELIAEAQGHLADAYKTSGNEAKYREIVDRQRESDQQRTGPQ